MAQKDSRGAPQRQGIGIRIKRRRTELGWSLRELARRAEVTASFLSQLERGQSDTSIGVLRRISEVLGVPMMYFLADGRRNLSVVRAESRPALILPEPKVRYELLVPDLARKMEALLGRLLPGAGDIVRPLHEPTEEFMFVLSGSLRIQLDSREYVLSAGDSVYFEGPELRTLTCASEEEVVWISVITPPVF